MSDPLDRKDDPEDDAVRRLVRRVLSPDRLAGETPDILRGVQRRLRQRSRGKFFGDGWSITQAHAGYVLAAVATLVLVALALLALSLIDMK